MENSFTLQWDNDPRGGAMVSEEVICDMEAVNSQIHQAGHLSPDTIIPDMDSEQIAAENLMYLSQDVVAYTTVQGEEGEVVEMVTEEVITDDWVQPGGQERVEVPLDQLVVVTAEQNNEENSIDVPLPTDQDEYTAMRPYPCDFCSRRFRKKANLVNHMTAHQNDRPYGCNLCGARYVRRCDLLHHLKVHAYVPDEEEDRDNEYDMLKVRAVSKRKARRRSRLSSENGLSISSSFSLDAETSVAARTQQYGGQGQLVNNNSINTTTPGGSSGRRQQHSVPVPDFAPVVSNRFSVTDPRRPFVCQHCGVGFAREKALASHARIHGGDSPLECSVCGELCWSREQLSIHYRNKHPHRAMPPNHSTYSIGDQLSDTSLPDVNDMGSPELTCKDCGAGFQRADLLRRHVKAAHSYKLEPPDPMTEDGSMLDEETERDVSGVWEALEHTCGACGEGFRDALDLLAHAESHARSGNNRCMQCGEKFTDEQSMCSHVETAHSPLSPYTCSTCGRVCNNKRALLKHMQTQHQHSIHLTQQLFCSKCGKSFHNKARLKRHMTSHRDKAVTCNICGESFTDGRSLMNHRHSHSSTTARQFPCRECGKTFGSRSSQQIHIRIHTGERPYACRFCWKAFADGGTLRKHERIHTGEKPYACAVCPRAFNQRVVLREHVRSHHSGPDARRGTGAAPFWCAVCGRLLHTSSDLVQHLIQHSDANTALKRHPQTGPRKYKRRRKLKPHEMEILSNTSEKIESEGSAPEQEMGLVEEMMEPVVPKRRASQGSRRGRKAKPLPPTPTEMEPPFTPVVDPVREGSARTKGKGKGKALARPKMIHTQKIKGSSEVVGAGAPTRGRRRCAVTSTTMEERRPRTKNVKHHDPPRPPTATFPLIKSEPDTDIAADLREILCAPNTTLPIKRERKARGGGGGEGASNGVVKQEVDPPDPLYKCEMCSLAFQQRVDLITHVRIHI